jgi:hypothetical protein
LTNEYGARWVWGGAAAIAAVAAVVGYSLARGIRAEAQGQPAPVAVPGTEAHSAER